MKTIVLSTNDNQNYFGYLPFVQQAWNNLGWHTLTFYLGEKKIVSTKENRIIKIIKSKVLRDETMVQVSRLFACCISDEYLMTSDVDMLPLSNYWKPDEKIITTWGRDLTDYGHYPICYIGMPAEKWRNVMGLEKSDTISDIIEKYLIAYPKAFSDKWTEWWQVDQDIITEKLLLLNPVVIERGKNGCCLAARRADRSDWNNTKDISYLIDAHLPHPFNVIEVELLIRKYFK